MNLTRSTFAKVLAGLLFIVNMTVFVVGIIAVGLISRNGGFSSTMDQNNFVNRMLQDQVYSDINEVKDYAALVLNGNSWTTDLVDNFGQRFDIGNTNFFFTVNDYDTQDVLLSNYTSDYRFFLREDAYISPAALDQYYSYSDYTSSTATSFFDYTTTTDAYALEPAYYEEDISSGSASSSNMIHVVITGYVRKDLGAVDVYRQLVRLGGTLYRHRSDALIGMSVCGIVSLVLFVFLMYSAGRRRGTEEITLRFVDRIPWDLMALLAAGLSVAAVLLFTLCYDSLFYQFYSLSDFLPPAVFTAAVTTVFLLLSLTFATRCKTKDWGHNSILYRSADFIGTLLHHPLRRFGELLRMLPLLWKTILLGVILIPCEVFCLYQLYWDSRIFPIVLFNVVVVLIILSAVLNMKKLQLACKAVADGDLDYRVDTSHMYLDYRRHGEDLNRIGAGISVAVEERLRSERFKTELITNVSHDLKTPLTSIVNYADLLDKLELPEQAQAYVEVLQRQSNRLKKLTEDLVEASKASTGNLPVEITTVDLGELMTQVVGEYEDRLQKAELNAVLELPESRIAALADGRYLWRVMDNLLSNVCKYALAGTRVYIDAARVGGRAILSVKNVSRDRLNVSADALLERFVRGDASRNTEGSGLGLSIAQSLAELMGGKLSLSVDGDLFKAELQLPLAYLPQDDADAPAATDAA